MLSFTIYYMVAYSEVMLEGKKTSKKFDEGQCYFVSLMGPWCPAVGEKNLQKICCYRLCSQMTCDNDSIEEVERNLKKEDYGRYFGWSVAPLGGNAFWTTAWMDQFTEPLAHWKLNGFTQDLSVSTN